MISIILNSYNLSHFIGEALTSLLNQDYDGEYEIIVVDDASTDDSKKVIESFSDPRIKPIFLTQNQGARHATELAFAQSTGSFICRFDADDVWPDYFLRRTSGILENHPEIDMIYGDYMSINEKGEITSGTNNIHRRTKELPVLEHEFIDILKKYYINAPTVMFRRASFARAMPMPQLLTNFIDWYISLRVLQSGKAYYIHEPLAYYRIHSANMHKAQISSRMGETVTNFILDEFVRKNDDLDPGLKKEIIAINAYTLAEKYFGLNLFPDALRLYKQCMKTNLAYLLDFNFLKHATGSLLGNRFYTGIKNLLRGGKLSAG